MSPEPADTSPEGALQEVIAAYLAAVQAGWEPDRQDLLARRPDLAGELAAFFADHDALKDLARPPHPAGVTTAGTDPDAGATAAYQPAEAPPLPSAESASTGNRVGAYVPAEPATLASGDGTLVAPALGARVRYVGDYELLEELGRGGMGVVYKAQQTKLKRLVALKMILAGEYAGAQELARFRSEGEAVARLQHPHIVQIFEVGEHEGHPYFSLEYCVGGSLEKKLQGTPLPPKEAAQLLETLARAMQAAHQAGVVHRDLKPANVLLTADGTPKITDFGLAKRLDAAAGPTASGAIMGTPSYMAPEQARGQNKAIGPAADVYALGALLYELLTGRPPFKAATPLDTVLQVINDEPVSPQQLQSRTPRDLETICLKCLQKDPNKRYASAAALAEDLQRFGEGKPIAARPVGVVERGWRWCRRNPVVAALAATVALSLLAGTWVSTYFAFEALARAKEADGNANTAQANALEARQEKRTGDHLLHAARMNLAQQAWEDNQMGRLRELLAGQRPEQTAGLDLRGFEWYYWDRLCHAEQLVLQNPAFRVSCVAFSPDGKRLASGGGSRLVEVWDAATGQKIYSLEGHRGDIASVVFSRDGKRLVSVAPVEGIVRIWDAVNGRPIRTLPSESKGTVSFRRPLAFSPDGGRLAIGGDRSIKVWDAKSYAELVTFEGFNGGVSVAFSPDGKKLVGADDHGTVKVWDQGDRELFTRKGFHLTQGVAFTPDGRFLATSGTNWEDVNRWSATALKCWDAASGQEVRTVPGPSGVVFSPDGRGWVAGGDGRTVKVCDMVTGREILTFKGHLDTVEGVAFSPDGKRLASAGDGTVRVWDLARSQEPLDLVPPSPGSSGFSCVALSPDWKQLAVGLVEMSPPIGDSKDKGPQPSGVIKVWDVGSKGEPSLIKSYTPAVWVLAFSEDGKRLAWAGRDGTVHVGDLSGGRKPLSFQHHNQMVLTCAFSPDGKYLAAAGADYGLVEVWDLASGQAVHALKGHNFAVDAVVFSPDGRRLASASRDCTAKLWDLASGQAVCTLKGHQGYVMGAVFSRDGKWLATAGGLTARVWDAHTGQELLTLKGHTAEVNSVAFSPDGKRVASGSEDRTIKVWDTATGQETLTLKGHRQGVRKVTFSPDGTRLVSVDVDGSVKHWDATPRP